MEFSEMSHAFIAARFYVRLIEAFSDRGKRAFIHATQYYAEQRGRRMAQRAIRDGHELTFDVYQQYGEWVSTSESIEGECSNLTEVVSYSPDCTLHISRCPWHAQFKAMGLTEAGIEYCKHLDNSICRGFNPYLVYDVTQTLHTSDRCVQILRGANFSEGSRYEKKREYLRPFQYHCAHSYWSYSEVSAAIFGAEGEEINALVLKDFREEYGADMADGIAQHKHTNFNVCG
ncbi:MAG: L-2-amino-thiazoline-4-carboxylic acid hydrolase [Fretibacterium sp.]|nr:L-2-amino-thiazoline-4-carboxylic acid hydrolase [Fretibacterium sp.]